MDVLIVILIYLPEYVIIYWLWMSSQSWCEGKFIAFIWCFFSWGGPIHKSDLSGNFRVVFDEGSHGTDKTFLSWACVRKVDFDEIRNTS